MRAGWQVAALVGLVLAVYANSLDNGFHFDDEHSILDNPALRSLGSVPSYFVDAGAFSGDPDMAMYRPVTLTTFAINHAAGDLEPFGYHLVNVVLHCGFAALLFFACARLTGRAAAAWWAVAAIAVHPVNSQIVNYVSSRSGILAALGVLGAFAAVALAPQPRLLPAAVSHAAGLLAKSTALAAAPLAAVWQWGRPGSRRAGPLLTLSGVSLAYLAAARNSGFLGSALEELVRPLHVQIMTQCKALVYYVYLLPAPFHLSVVHPFAESGTPEPVVLCATLAAVSVLGLGAGAWRRGRLVGFGVIWFYGGLALTSAMPLHVIVSEQRLYLSCAGLAIGACALGIRHRWLAVLLICFLAVLTWQRNDVWQDELSLWTDAARLAPGSDRVHVNLGEAYYEAGDTIRARAEYARAVSLNPESQVAWLNLGILHENGGDVVAAERATREALRLRPDWPEALAILGRVLLHQGRAGDAEALLARAVDRRPTPVALVNLGVAESRSGKTARAAVAFAQALSLDPGRQEARINLAALRLQQAGGTSDEAGRERLFAEAAALYEELLGSGEGDAHPTVLINLASVRASTGDEIGARRLYERALREHPENTDAYVGFARFLTGRGEQAAAVEVLRDAVARGNASMPVWRELGRAEARQGEFTAAAAALREAVLLDAGQTGVRYDLAEVLFAIWESAAAKGEEAVETGAEAVRIYRSIEAMAPDYRLTRQRLHRLEEETR